MKQRSAENILQRTAASLLNDGLSATFLKLRMLIADYLFDFDFGVKTCGLTGLDELTINGDNKERGNEYKPTSVVLLRKVFGLIEPLIPSESVLVDFGCGKGRVLLVGAEFGFREGRGVEFARELCEIARKNCARYKGIARVRTEFRIIESDAVNYPVQTDDNVFFLFNPFDETILKKVIDNIVASLRDRLRRILIIYHNPLFSSCIEQCDNFARLREVNFWGNKIAIYTNRTFMP